MREPLSPDEVGSLIFMHREPCEGPEEREFHWDFGQVTLAKDKPIFRVGYWEQLRPDAKFFAAPFDGGPRGRGVAAMFETADARNADQNRRVYPVGWVPMERERELDLWIATLNLHIGRLISTNPPRGAGTPIDIGMYKEFGYDDEPGARSLFNVRRTPGRQHKAEVVAYLRRARTTAFAMGLEPDVFDPTKLAGHLSGKTDGTYRWPELLAYYVENYDIALPDDFEDHMRKNGWKVPQDS